MSWRDVVTGMPKKKHTNDTVNRHHWHAYIELMGLPQFQRKKHNSTGSMYVWVYLYLLIYLQKNQEQHVFVNSPLPCSYTICMRSMDLICVSLQDINKPVKHRPWKINGCWTPKSWRFGIWWCLFLVQFGWFFRFNLLFSRGLPIDFGPEIQWFHFEAGICWKKHRKLLQRGMTLPLGPTINSKALRDWG